MKKVLLEDILLVLESGSRPKGGVGQIASGVLSLGAEHLDRDGGFCLDSPKYVPHEFYAQLSKGKVSKGDILIVKDGATTGKVSFVDGLFEGRSVSINEHVFRLVIDESKADSRFVFHYLSSPQGATEVLSDFRGATVGGISRRFVSKVKVPFPSLPEQRRIAAILDRADAIRRKRREAIELMNGFLRSVFLEMFGDPISNSKDWAHSRMGEIARVERGKFTPRPRNDPSYYGGEYPFIQTGDITNSKGRLRGWTQTLNKKGVKVSKCFPPGTIVIAIVGATIGMTAILEVEVYCPDSVVGIQVNEEKATKEYIEFLLRFWRPIFLAQAPATARANINLDTLRPLQVALPPITLQRNFSLIAQTATSLLDKNVSLVRVTENLVDSLSYRLLHSSNTETH